jgi:hypothetical protein
LHRARDQVVALERARWLAELAEAIAQAQRLAWQLGVAEGDLEEARELYARLEVVRAEVELLRSSGWVEVRREVEPGWLDNLLPASGPRPFRGGFPGL